MDGWHYEYMVEDRMWCGKVGRMIDMKETEPGHYAIPVVPGACAVAEHAARTQQLGARTEVATSTCLLKDDVMYISQSARSSQGSMLF